MVTQNQSGWYIVFEAERRMKRALADFDGFVDRMPKGGINSDAEYSREYFSRQRKYIQAVKEWELARDLYEDELIAAEGIPVVMPGYVKENADNFSSK